MGDDNNILGLVRIIQSSNNIKQVQYAYGRIVYTLGLEVLERFANLAYGPDHQADSEQRIAEQASLEATSGGTHPKTVLARQAPGSGPHPEVIVSTVNNALRI